MTFCEEILGETANPNSYVDECYECLQPSYSKTDYDPSERTILVVCTIILPPGIPTATVTTVSGGPQVTGNWTGGENCSVLHLLLV